MVGQEEDGSTQEPGAPPLRDCSERRVIIHLSCFCLCVLAVQAVNSAGYWAVRSVVAEASLTEMMMEPGQGVILLLLVARSPRARACLRALADQSGDSGPKGNVVMGLRVTEAETQDPSSAREVHRSDTTADRVPGALSMSGGPLSASL
mmetsp:Transcript_138902/g.312566  ORF Transcript_138902/g.312566 Transcript_138902/m.312566 type:complete len:149 (+) Transcript_138902:3-449(+)